MNQEVWQALYRLDAVVRPFGSLRPPLEGRGSSFKAAPRTTLRDLALELRSLNAENIVLELDVRERDIRLDGLPRADAKPQSAAVGISFESKWGRLRYATGKYARWQDNLRAIVLTMNALRAVDRYGVSDRGEQYQGWKALPASTDPADAIQTREQAQAYLDENWGGDIARALMETHPDRGGNADDVRAVLRARALIA